MPGRLANLDQLRADLAAYLTTALPTLEVHSFARGSINPPAIVVTPSPGPFLDYRVTFDNALNYTMRLVLLASMADAETGTAQLDAMLDFTGPASIVAALEADPTLGGTVDFAVPTIAQRYGALAYGGVDYLGCELMIEIAAP